MNYPVACDTDAKKIVFLIRAQGILRVLYKAFTHWRYDGITQNQYDNMNTILGSLASNIGVIVTQQTQFDKVTAWIKNNYTFTARLTDTQYKEFLTKHEDLWQKASGAERKLLDKYINDEAFEINLGDIDVD